MNSSQVARMVGAVLILLSALVLATAQQRALRRPEPRTHAYLVAWLVTVALIGGLRSASDYMVGNASTGRTLLGFAWTAAACALSLFVSHRVVRGGPEFFLRFALHAVVMALVSYIRV